MAPIKVLVTGAAGQIAYNLTNMIANGNMFGKDQGVILHLLDIPQMEKALRGVEMELSDCAFPCLEGVVVTTDLNVAFKDIDVALMVGAMPRRQGMERADLLEANVKIFKSQGKALDQHAKKTVKVIVVGNPANTNCLMMSHFAPSIPKENFSALTRLDHNRAIFQVANKIGVANKDVKNVAIWGNHSATQYPDIHHATANIKGVPTKVTDTINDEKWMKDTFIPCVQKRGAAVIEARKLSSAASAAKAIVDHMRDWWCGTEGDVWVSMAVISNGNKYGVPDGLVYSFPVKIKDGKWEIVNGLSMDQFSQEKLAITTKELISEREIALKTCEA